MIVVTFELVDWGFPEPTQEDIRVERNRRPHCANCGGFVSAKTLRYVNGDDLWCQCVRCGDMRVSD